MATITWPGPSHENLIPSMDGLPLRVVDTEDPSHVVLQVDIPTDRFISSRRSARYDRAVAFPGRVHLHNRRKQADTVQIDVRFKGTFEARPDSVRGFIEGPESCAHTCVSDCAAARRRGLRCHTPGTEDAGSSCTSDSECPGPGDPATRSVCASGVPPFGHQAPLFNNGAHGSTGTAAARSQINAFLQDGGQILQTCSGRCNPE